MSVWTREEALGCAVCNIYAHKVSSVSVVVRGEENTSGYWHSPPFVNHTAIEFHARKWISFMVHLFHISFLQSIKIETAHWHRISSDTSKVRYLLTPHKLFWICSYRLSFWFALGSMISHETHFILLIATVACLGPGEYLWWPIFMLIWILAYIDLKSQGKVQCVSRLLFLSHYD